MRLRLVSDAFEKEGFVAEYELAIKEYSNCNLLLLNMARLMGSGLAIYAKHMDVEKYILTIESLYEKVADVSFSCKADY